MRKLLTLSILGLASVAAQPAGSPSAGDAAPLSTKPATPPWPGFDIRNDAARRAATRPALPRALYGRQGNKWKPTAVYTATGLDELPLDESTGLVIRKQVIASNIAIVLDAELLWDNPERVVKYSELMKQVQRETKLPTSAYGNVDTHYYWCRPTYAKRLAKQGIAVGGRTVEEWLAHQPPTVNFAARKAILDVSAWSVPALYLIDDVTEPWEELAIPHEMARVCRDLAPAKPVVGYVSPRIYRSTDFTPLGLCEMDRWKRYIEACLDACDALVFYGHISEGDEAENEVYWQVLKAAAEARSKQATTAPGR